MSIFNIIDITSPISREKSYCSEKYLFKLTKYIYISAAPTSALKPKVKAYLGSIGVDFDIGQKNACDSLTNAYCPLDEGEEVTYALKMPVQSFYPKVKLNIQFSLIDDQGNKQVCFFVAAKVTDLPNIL